MDEIALARHGESEAAANGLVGGDTPLTPGGRDEARVLGERLRSLPVDICVTSKAARARETATIALEGRDVPVIVDAELGDIQFGDFEGQPLAAYRQWIAAHDPAEAPPGAESRVETLRRFVRAFRRLLERRERVVLVVAHGLTVRSVLDPGPQPVVAGTPYGGLVILAAAEFEHAVQRLERWCESPAW